MHEKIYDSGHVFVLSIHLQSKKNEENTIVETYLKYRMDNYKKYKKIFPSEKENILQNENYDLTG